MRIDTAAPPEARRAACDGRNARADAAPPDGVRREPGLADPRRPSRWSLALGSLATNGFIALIGLATGSLAARILGPQGRGELASIQNAAILLGAVALMGMPSALTFYCAKDRSAARGLYTSALVTALTASVALVAIGWLLLPAILKQHGDQITRTARVYLVFIPLNVLAALPFSALLGIGDISAWNILRLLAPLAWLTTLGVSALWGADASRVATIYLTLYACVIPITTLTMLRKVAPGNTRPSLSMVRKLVTFGAPGALGTIPYQLNLRLDQVVMAAILPAAELGLYSVGVAWSGVLTPVLAAIAPLALPFIADRDIEEDQRGATAAAAARIALLVAAVGTILVAIATPLAVGVLFGSQFRAATTPAVVLAFAGGLAGLNTVLEELLKGLGAPRWPLYSQVASIPVTVVLLVLLLSSYGALGAAVASLVAYGTSTVLLFFGLKVVARTDATALCIPRLAEILAVGHALASAVRGRRPT